MLPHDARRGEFVGNVVPLRQDDVRIAPPHPSEHHVASVAPTSERTESCARRMHSRSEGEMSVMKESLTPYRRDREVSLAAQIGEKSPQKRITIEFG